jgi:hypothetical protein
MDNFHVDITAEGDATLVAAMKLAFRPHSKAVGYAVRSAFAGEREDMPEGAPKWHRPDWKYGKRPKPLRLVFFWSDYEKRADMVPFPFKQDAEGAAEFARRWLAEADYGSEPDHDGDNGKGWRLYNEAWGHVDSDHSAFVAVAPEWAMYGK